MSYEFPLRKIIHVDMDAFYASVEQLDNPELKGKPLAVGGGETRGVVAAASYEARKYGVRSAMSGYLAKKNCPELIFVKPRFARYKEISQKIRNIFLDYSDLVEPLSLDEAYLDVTVNKKGNPSATLIAHEIRQRIYDELKLSASAGISINKFIAKVASDINKPNGQKTVNPEEVISFLEGLEIRKFYGVGKVTADKMYRLGIFTGLDLKTKSLDFLEDNFGKSGIFYFNVVRGIHLSPVKPNRIPKSVGAERTFDENLSSEIFMLERLDNIAK
ncbi:MAG: DNA polymerase IV, partial [Flavobacteriales bacterium]